MKRTKFAGQIGQTVDSSKPWWPPAHPSSGRPNILTIVLDDLGWSDLGCFGSQTDTSNIDRIANMGTRFTRFHVTPLCSPTRACMFTGKDHHQVGMRFLADADTGFPNGRGRIDPEVPTLPELLREAGYGTYLIGKWHLAPLHEITPAGPMNNWPLARGFERFYGFLDGCTDQYSPELFCGNEQVTPPPREDYILTEDLVDNAIKYLKDHITFRPDDPFYLNLALPATHAPFQAPPEYVDKYRDKFNHGWDEERQRRLERQKELGIVPPDTSLTEPSIGSHEPREWKNLDPDEQNLNSVLQATFAGFLDHTDKQLGRLFVELERLGIFDNTIIVIFSDNGASREGSMGDIDCNVPYSQTSRSVKEQITLLEQAGSIIGPVHYAQEWAMAGNTPFRFFKQWVDLGGVRSPLIVRWADRQGGRQTGDINSSFVHVMDIFPTLLRAAGVEIPTDTEGRDFTEAIGTGSVLKRSPVAFEMLGHRAMHQGEWTAIVDHKRGDNYEEENWRLYHETDFSHVSDLSDQYPDVLRELEQSWWQEAQRLDFFPLDDRGLVDLLTARNPEGLLSREHIRLRPGQGHVPFPSGVTGTDRPLEVVCTLNGFTGKEEGVLVASGNENSGYTLYIKDGCLRFEHHFANKRLLIAPDNPIDHGHVRLGFTLVPLPSRTGKINLWVEKNKNLADSKTDQIKKQIIAQSELPITTAHLSFYGLDVGHDPVSTVGSYPPPFAFPPKVLETVDLFFDPNCDISGYVLAREMTQ